MNSQIQTQIITILFVLFFTFTLSPFTLFLHITTLFNIHFLMQTTKSQSNKQLPCTYIFPNMDKTKSLFKKLKPTTTKVTPMITTELSKEQKEAALPFLTEQPIKQQKSSKSKSIGKFFKKLAKATTTINKKSNKNNTEYKLTFIPIINETPSEPTELVWTAPIIEQQQDESSAEIAQRIWDNDVTVYENLENVIEWIGNGKSSSNAILKHYMSHFDFQSISLEQAFRNLCLKLHLKGESQQIDRILSEFAGRYFECNPTCVFGSSDVVHAIVYSLLLLNTDLHVAQGDYKKMSRSEFIHNTLSAIQSQNPTSSPASFHSLDWIPLQRTPSNTSSKSSTYAQSLDLPRPLSSYTLGSKAWQLEIKHLLKHMYNSIRQNQLANPSSSSNTPSMRKVSSVFRRSHLFMKRDDDETMSIAATSIASSSFTTTSPYYKEGMVVRKHLLEKKDQKAKHRDWKDCFMVIERSQLRMYNSKKKQVTMIDLKHSLANALPSGYSRQRSHVFAVNEANGAVTLFQVGSAAEVQEWVSACNYWAARESKEPLLGGVSSMEYGWGNTNGTVYEWQAPVPPMMSSSLLDDEASQLEALYTYVNALTEELDHHRDLKQDMELKFLKNNNKYGARVMMNWENKSHYLLKEIIKYQNYCQSIEKSLAMSS